MKKKRRVNGRIIISCVFLLVLAALAFWKAGDSHFSGPDTESAASSEGREDVQDNTADTTPSIPDPKKLDGSANAAEEEAEMASFLPDYTSAPLLDTTDIRCLTMEVGASETELRFNWLSPSALAGEVRLTDTESGKTLSFKSECSASVTVPGYYVNKAVASKLKPGASYTYQVGNDEAWSPEYPYQCPEEGRGILTFLVTADAQIGQSEMEYPADTAERWDSVVTRLTDYFPDASFLFHLGDQVADFGSQEHYELFLQHLALYSIPLAPASGNHDVADPHTMELNGHPGGPYFYEHFNVPNRSETGQSLYDQDGNYYFIRGNVLFIVLNSSSCQGVEVQEQYVAQIVSEHPDIKWRILAQHFPAYTGAVNSHTGCREYLARIAEANDIDLILGAHDHVYSRTAFVNGICEALDGYPYASGSTAVNPEGTLYITCGTSSGCLYHEPDSEDQIVKQLQPYAPMAIRFDVTDTELHMRAYQADTWALLDEYTIRKDAGAAQE